MTTIDGVDTHFLHVRSPVKGATPYVVTHGWPGSVIEFFKVIDLLVDLDAPARHVQYRDRAAGRSGGS